MLLPRLNAGLKQTEVKADSCGWCLTKPVDPELFNSTRLVLFLGCCAICFYRSSCRRRVGAQPSDALSLLCLPLLLLLVADTVSPSRLLLLFCARLTSSSLRQFVTDSVPSSPSCLSQSSLPSLASTHAAHLSFYLVGRLGHVYIKPSLS